MKKVNIDNQLKPCPFCGSKVNSYKGFGGLVFIKCSVCGSITSFDNDWCKAKPYKAIKLWNRRSR